MNNFVSDSHVDAFFYFRNWLSVINFSQSSSLHQPPDVLHSVLCVPRPFSSFYFNVRLPLYLPSFKKWAGLIPPPLLMWQISSNDSTVAPGSSHWKHEPPLSLFFTPFSHSRTFSRPLHSLFPAYFFWGGGGGSAFLQNSSPGKQKGKIALVSIISLPDDNGRLCARQTAVTLTMLS